MIKPAALANELPEQLRPAFRYRCYVTRVIDGDTVVIDWDLGDGLWSLGRRVRLLGINARETRGPLAEQGHSDKAYLERLIMDFYLSRRASDGAFELTICTRLNKSDEFNRLLGQLWGIARATNEPVNLNEKMIDDGHAVPFMESGSK